WRGLATVALILSPTLIERPSNSSTSIVASAEKPISTITRPPLISITVPSTCLPASSRVLPRAGELSNIAAKSSAMGGGACHQAPREQGLSCDSSEGRRNGVEEAARSAG